MSTSDPGYRALFESGELAQRAERATDGLTDCAMCARQCHANRLDEAHLRSYCRTGRSARVANSFAHHGEEACLRGSRGSGTVFFSYCNLRCVFCQNCDISWEGHGRPVAPEELAEIMLSLERRGCHNLNFVTPSHVVAQILEALCLAVERGLRLPIVYNTGGYDSPETLRLLDGVVDVYMPDFKFWDPQVSKELANADDYRDVACCAIAEMHRQVGDLVIDRQGLARRGLLVRHLVMPGGQAGTRDVMHFLAQEISPDTFVNIMAQYRPAGRAHEHASINRSVTLDEFSEAVAVAHDEGLRRFNHG